MTKEIFIILSSLFISINLFSQDSLDINTINLSSLDLTSQTLLFKQYELIGMNCVSKKDFPRHCNKIERMFDSSIGVLQLDKENTLYYLKVKYEDISVDELDKKEYADKNKFRYFIEYKPVAGKFGQSCFSNPGALVMNFILFDRLEDKRYDIDLNYSMFTCDIQILVNEINKNFKKVK